MLKNLRKVKLFLMGLLLTDILSIICLIWGSYELHRTRQQLYYATGAYAELDDKAHDVAYFFSVSHNLFVKLINKECDLERALFLRNLTFSAPGVLKHPLLQWDKEVSPLGLI